MSGATTSNVPDTDAAPSLVERVTSLYSDYAWAVDDQDFGALRTLLTPDVRLSANEWEAEGVEEFVATYQRLLSSLAGPCRHLITNVRAHRSADGLIHTGAYFQAVFHAESTLRVQTGRYRDIQVETPAGLRISHKRIEIDPTRTLRTEPLLGGAGREDRNAT